MARHASLTTNARERREQQLAQARAAARQIEEAAMADLLKRAQEAKRAFDLRSGRA